MALTLNLPSCHVFLSALLYYSLFKGSHTQSGVGGGPALLGVDLRHPEEDSCEDDGVEDADEGDAQHDPQRHEADLPRPRYQSVVEQG